MFDDDEDLLLEAEEPLSKKTVAIKKPCPPPPVLTHTHEFTGSTRLTGEGDLTHNHSFSGVTTGEIPLPGGSHVHSFDVNTDTAFTHFHEVSGTTGPAIILNPQAPPEFRRHVHLAIGNTTVNVGHVHVFIFATLIENPTTP